MPTPKTWTAHDIQLGKLTITRDGSNFQFERRYRFLDEQGDDIEHLAGGTVLQTIPWEELPADVKSALSKLDVWTRTEALVQEGMA
ncbi:MAG TPA: hypothetical protein VM537_12975 [Anaerolineae bacterium]|nr:hypothetical protein [Anaerolineae bacterium]